MEGDPERAVATARRGLDADDDVTGIGICRSLMALSLSAIGRIEESKLMLPALQETINSNADFEVRWQAAHTTSNLLVGDPAGPTAQTEMEALTKEIGAPTYLAEATRLRGMHTLFDHAAPDADAALAYFRTALQQYQAAGTDTTWGEFTVALGLMMTGHQGASAATRDMIANTYEVRNWAAIEPALELAARVLVEAGAHVEATNLYGHLELHPAAWGDFGTMFRSESLNMLAPPDDAETLRATGAALGRHELVAYALAALDAAQPYPETSDSGTAEP
jgi:hypothetical protein